MEGETPEARRGDDVTLQLVFLAAGRGSRYGGLKQLEAVGPGDSTLMEYSLYDARRAGFGDIVFVIRADMQDAFSEYARARFGSAPRLSWRTAIQRLEDVPPGTALPAGRVKPWGTAHALLAAADQIHGPFAVLNADDFYGAPAFTALAQFLRAHTNDRPPSYAIVGYPLRETLSGAGAVNRGVCRTVSGGWLDSIEEVVGLDRASDGEQLVSMNLWGFTPAVFATLREGFARFVRSPGAGEGEYLLPTVIDEAVRDGRCRVRVLDPGSRWFGITYPADVPGVVAALRGLVAEGHYPERLWE